MEFFPNFYPGIGLGSPITCAHVTRGRKMVFYVSHYMDKNMPKFAKFRIFGLVWYVWYTHNSKTQIWRSGCDYRYARSDSLGASRVRTRVRA